MYTMGTIDVDATKILLHEMRIARNLSVDEVREALCLESVQAIYKHESLNIKNLPSIDSFLAYAQLYGCRIDDSIVVR